MNELKKIIKQLLLDSKIDKADIELIEKEESLDPFSTEGRFLAFLLSKQKISLSKYNKIAEEFCVRHRDLNKYLYLFDMAPRTFGQTWGEQHIKKLFPEFIKATKKNLSNLYPSFDGEFDLWIDGIRVEVKACRANSTSTKKSLSSRAYSHEDAINKSFKYHYQQLKPSCCDVFIWIGVCKDQLLYWVLTSKELQETGKLGSQHRNENTGKSGVEVFEGQVFMTEEELSKFAVNECDILETVKAKGGK